MSNLNILDLAAISSAIWTRSNYTVVEARLREVWGRLGLDTNAPLVSGTTTITFDQIVMAMTEANNTVTVTRQ